MMFIGSRKQQHPRLEVQFKNVFHNISRALDCVGCQKCRLHGKLQLLGIGTALKVLLTPVTNLSTLILSREEIVGLINTISKFSSAISSASKLTTMYWTQIYEEKVKSENEISAKSKLLKGVKDFHDNSGHVKSIPMKTSIPTLIPNTSPTSSSLTNDVDELDRTMSLVSRLAIGYNGRASGLSVSEEDVLIQAILHRTPEVLILGKHYGNRPDVFLRHIRKWLANIDPRYFSTLKLSTSNDKSTSDDSVVIVGGGLAGLTAAVRLLDAGVNVIILEKENFFGGNSAKASSGINGIDSNSVTRGDSQELFLEDMINGGGLIKGVNDTLAEILTKRSSDALTFLRDRVGLKIDKLGQLGGHSKPRTHRPGKGMSGVEIILALEKILKETLRIQKKEGVLNSKGFLRVMKRTEMKDLLMNSHGEIRGIKYETLTKEKQIIHGNIDTSTVILATGGFAADRTKTSLLKKHRPELLQYGTTNGDWATGDGHKIAMTVGAAAIEMDFVQVHPTGFIDPLKPSHGTKTLCAELLRGVGGIILDNTGNRFVNELDTREKITAKMTEHAKNGFSIGKQNEMGNMGSMSFVILLNAAAAAEADKHVPLYERKGLLQKFSGLQEVANWLQVDVVQLNASLLEYDISASKKSDKWGKKVFNNLPFMNEFSDSVYYGGIITPVLHYCMGGLRVNSSGAVLRDNGSVISGLFAAGEIVGGIHGRNRLGGNALTEAVVFGQVSADAIISQVKDRINNMSQTRQKYIPDGKSDQKEVDVGLGLTENNGSNNTMRVITTDELKHHNSEKSTWVVLYGKVYDFTDFLDEHPAGPEAILQLGGQDGTDNFANVHTIGILEEFEPIGIYNE